MNAQALRTSPVIAVVDSDDAARASFEALLNGAGYDVTVFSSGRSFLDELTSLSADCVLLEYRMPDLGGHILAQRLRTLVGRPPLILMSTMPKLISPARVRELGAIMALEKPIEENSLFDALEFAIDMRTSASPSIGGATRRAT